MATELGRIAVLLEETGESLTPLQRRLARFGLWLAVAIVVICTILFIVGYLRGEAPLLMFLTAVSLAVAAIPEALPAVVTIALALGARRMAQRHALVRRLPAVETLGSVTHICTDKTGTLTRNRMTVTTLWPQEAASGEGERARLLRGALILCTDVRPTAGGELLGDPTETALYTFAVDKGASPQRLKAELPRVAELPFSAERARMTTFHRDGVGVVAFMKGGTEAVLGASVDASGEAGTVPLDREEVLAAAERLSAEGLRVLAVAMARRPSLPHPLEPQTVETGFTFLGLVGMLDPPRPEAAPAVALCKSAGIVPVMITGDHPATAAAIAGRLGILEPGGEVVTGVELGRLDTEGLAARAGRIRVYARVAPEQKLAIVRALQGRGHVVAMTGDGVNDAPALKCADIGIAMGESGTDVAREAAALVLLDDNFATIVAAVEEGRRIYANILKFIVYSLTGNAGTLWAITLAPFVGLPLPLLPLQILWLNLLCDSLPGLALAVEPAEERLMARPPIDPGEGIFARGRGLFILGYGLAIGGVALLIQSVALRNGLPWQTMVFTFLVCNRMVVALVVRSPRRPLLHTGLFSNRPLAGAILVTFALHLAAVYLSPLSKVLKTVPLSGTHLGVALFLAMGMVVSSEGVKWVRGRFGREGLEGLRRRGSRSPPSRRGSLPPGSGGGSPPSRRPPGGGGTGRSVRPRVGP
jgi:Ca2+-transporting ATPase